MKQEIMKIGNKITLFANRTWLKTKEKSPEILIGAGIAGFVFTAVLAVKASKKHDAEIESLNLDISDIRDDKNTYEDPKEYRHDLVAAYTAKAVTEVKIWSPVVLSGVASSALILSGAGIMRKRYAGVVAAYNVLDQSFKDYRTRVIEECGEDADLYFRNGIKKVDVSGKYKINEETGEAEEIDTKTKLVKTDTLGHSQYARFFDESSPRWKRNAELNLLTLRGIEMECNNRLKIKGHLFLNEVYDLLEIPRSREGAVVGWIISKDGDNYVDFGIYDILNEKNRDFVNGYEESILLDFNVDGVIYDKI